MQPGTLKVGEFARRSGVSVRTLHHYDAFGLLAPSDRGSGGHRLYSEADVERLLRILALRQLALPLERIREVLDDPATSTAAVLERHLAHVESRLEEQRRLRDRLRALADRARDATTLDDLLEGIHAMNEIESYYTPEQREELARRADELGPEGLRRAEESWRELLAEVRAEIAAGTPPESERARALAERWNALVEGFTGGDPGIRANLARLYRERPDAAAEHGFTFDPELAGWIARASAAGPGA